MKRDIGTNSESSENDNADNTPVYYGQFQDMSDLDE